MESASIFSIAPLDDLKAADYRNKVAEHFSQTSRILRVKLQVPPDATNPSINDLERILAKKSTSNVTSLGCQYLAEHLDETPSAFSDIVRTPSSHLPLRVF